MSTTHDLEGALAVGRRAADLLEEHQGRLSGRLPAGTADAVAHRIRVLEASKPGVPLARHDAKGATASERELAEQITNAVMTIRAGLRARNLLSPAELKRWGVGLVVSPTVTKTVLAGADAIVSAASGRSEAELLELGLRQRDVRALEVMMTSLAALDEAQREKKGAAKTLASGRNAAIAETFQLAFTIGNAGAVEFSPIGSDPSAGEPPLPEVESLFRKLASDAVPPSTRKQAAKRKAAKKPVAS